jgi:hypothetical protein
MLYYEKILNTGPVPLFCLTDPYITLDGRMAGENQINQRRDENQAQFRKDR